MQAPVSARLTVYKTKSFARFAHKACIRDAALWKSALLADSGIIDADLGGGVIKLRIARAGEGKSGGSRCIVLFCRKQRAVFVHGFEKKDQGNIRANELEAFRELARIVLGYSRNEMSERVADGALIEIQPSTEGRDDKVSQ